MMDGNPRSRYSWGGWQQPNNGVPQATGAGGYQPGPFGPGAGGSFSPGPIPPPQSSGGYSHNYPSWYVGHEKDYNAILPDGGFSKYAPYGNLQQSLENQWKKDHLIPNLPGTPGSGSGPGEGVNNGPPTYVSPQMASDPGIASPQGGPAGVGGSGGYGFTNIQQYMYANPMGNHGSLGGFNDKVDRAQAPTGMKQSDYAKDPNGGGYGGYGPNGAYTPGMAGVDNALNQAYGRQGYATPDKFGSTATAGPNGSSGFDFAGAFNMANAIGNKVKAGLPAAKPATPATPNYYGRINDPGDRFHRISQSIGVF